MVTIIKPPQFKIVEGFSVFLAGTIDMGNSEDWQTRLSASINKAMISENLASRQINIYNPRREEWNNTIRQSIEEPLFFQQVTWELRYLEQCKYRIFYFAHKSKSPITLMELGRFGDFRSLVFCDPTYEKKGNVEVFCNRYNINIYATELELINHLLKFMKNEILGS